MKLQVTFIIMMLLLTSGCSSISSQSDGKASPTKMFSVEPHRTKVFFYAAYNDPDDEPFLGDTFRLHIDGSDIVDIDADQYIETQLSPGVHTFSIDRILWSGNITSQSSAALIVASGKPTFIEERVMPDDKDDVIIVDAAQGEKAVMQRTRRCLCTTSIGRFLSGW